MGLLLSVLVVCVGVLEVIACVRHFQDGYLPLWTPHCAVTSGCTSSYERWRKKPSESFEIRSSEGVREVLSHKEDQSSEYCLGSSPSIQNGVTGKQLEVGEHNDTSNEQFLYQDSKSDRDYISTNIESENIIDGNIVDDRNITGDFAEYDIDELRVSNEDVIVLNDRISHNISEEKSQDAFHSDSVTGILSGKVPEATSVSALHGVSDVPDNYSVIPSHDFVPANEPEEIFYESNKIETTQITSKEDEICDDIRFSRTDFGEKIIGDDAPVNVEKEHPQEIDSYTESEFDSQPNVYAERTIDEVSSHNTVEEHPCTTQILDDNITTAGVTESLPQTRTNVEETCYSSEQYDSQNQPDEFPHRPETQVTTEELEIEAESSVPFFKSDEEESPFDNKNTIILKTLDESVNEVEPVVSSDLYECASYSPEDKMVQEDRVDFVIPPSDTMTEEVYSSNEVNIQGEQLETAEEIKCSDPELNENNVQSDLEILIGEGETAGHICDTRIDEEETVPQENLEDITLHPTAVLELSTGEDTTSKENVEDGTLHLTSAFKEIPRKETDPQENLQDAISHPITDLEENVTQETVSQEYLESSTLHPTDVSLHKETAPQENLEDITSHPTTTQEENICEETTLQENLKGISHPTTVLEETIHKESFAEENLEDITPHRTREVEENLCEEPVPRENLENITPYHITTFEESLTQESVPHGNLEDITLQPTSVIKESLGDDSIEFQHNVLESHIESDPRSPEYENETPINITNEEGKQGDSGICLNVQTISTVSVESDDKQIIPQKDTSIVGDDLIENDVQKDISELHSSSISSVTSLTADNKLESSLPVSPLTIDTSDISIHSSHLSSDHQAPPSPTMKVPSTPKKSKADISWPTFFPGAPVIKRPSVSFATPEAVFTNEDQELLRQFAEEGPSAPPCIKKSDDSNTTESEITTSTSERSTYSSGASERSDSIEEEAEPIIFREKSPSNIVSGNDFSRKELALQRKKSYKHKRYSSATEIATRDEETEDRSFSENKPGVVRASSLKEPRKRFRKPAKASSFEDVLLRDNQSESITTSDDIADISIPEGKESERVETQEQEEAYGETIREETKEVSDDKDFLTTSIERIEPQSKPLVEEIGRVDPEEDQHMEECVVEEGEDYSASEEQSSTQSKNPSGAFWLIFSGEYTKAMSKDWHSGHFCCWQCDESLTGQRYVLRDDHPYCIKCYESVFANVCEECNKTIGIDSKDLSYKDKHWHEACFLCNKCRVSLVDKQFGSKADKIYCGNCYDAQFASRCDGCGEIFRAGTKKMEYKTRQWHEKCFCCCVCKTAIGTKSFIPREQEIYCATCYEEKFATRCVKCNKIITSGGVTYKNEPWHRECFTCTHCNTSLAGQRFTSRDEKPYCADCFGELFAKRCTACSKPITGIGGTRFISFEDRHWHNDCFICASCKTSLVGRGFITDADDIICPDCAKQKLM